MISAAPIAATAPFDEIRKVAAFIATASVAATNGITWAEFADLGLALVRLSVETLDSVSGMSGPDKKALVLDAVAALFDRVADKAVPAVAYPVWLVIKPAVRSLVLAIADRAVEQILAAVRS